jgi:hypothetical protein
MCGTTAPLFIQGIAFSYINYVFETTADDSRHCLDAHPPLDVQ